MSSDAAQPKDTHTLSSPTEAQPAKEHQTISPNPFEALGDATNPNSTTSSSAGADNTKPATPSVSLPNPFSPAPETEASNPLAANTNVSTSPSIPQPAATIPTQPTQPTPIAQETTADRDVEPRPDHLNEQDAPVDPRIAGLKAMFPDFDDSVLQSVLESVGGDQDRAIDMLLGMSDPEYKSEATPHPRAQNEDHAMSQTELDEQFARQLVIEEQQQHHNQWLAQHEAPPQRAGAVPYATRPPRNGSQQNYSTGPPVQGQQGTATSDFQEQFNKIAETGKKTFGNIFSKVKAKLNELDQPRPNQGTSATGTQPQWGSTPNTNTNEWAQQQQQYQQYQQQHDSSRYATGTTSPPVEGYNASPPSEPITLGSNVTNTGSQSQSQPPHDSTSTPPPPTTSTGAPIDGGKIGVLPKRPVSLVQPTQPQSRDSDDDLEYAESPFADNRR